MNYIDFSDIHLKINDELIYCDTAQLSISLDVGAAFNEGSIVPNYFSPTSIHKGSLNVQYYLTGKDPVYDYVYETESPINLDFAGLTINSGYLTSYSFKAQPYTLVQISTSFEFFEKPKGYVQKKSEVIAPLKMLSVDDIVIGEFDPYEGTNIYASNFSATDDDGWVERNCEIDHDYTDSTQFKMTANGLEQYHRATKDLVAIKQNTRYKVTAQVFVPAGAPNVKGFQFRYSNGHSGPLIHPTLDEWYDFSYEFVPDTVADSYDGWIEFWMANSSTVDTSETFNWAGAQANADYMYVRNIVVTDIEGVRESQAETIDPNELVSMDYSYSTSVLPSYEVQEATVGEVPVSRVTSSNKNIKSSFTTYDYDLKSDLSLPNYAVTMNFGDQEYKIKGPIVADNSQVDTSAMIINQYNITQGVTDFSPIITSFSANQGSVGTVVTVQGKNIEHLTAVFFKEFLCDIDIIDDTSFTVTIPEEAWLGLKSPLQIITLGGKMYTTQTFEVTS